MAVMGKVEASIDPDAIVADWNVLLRVDRPLTRSWNALRDGQRLFRLQRRVGRELAGCTSVEDMATGLSQCFVLHKRGEFGKERQRKHQCRVVVGQVQIGSGEGLAGKTSVHDPRGLFQQSEHPLTTPFCIFLPFLLAWEI
jgi:hypothetical protein